jgi:glycosyltransferase involved in cell wall biosynthesis
MKRFLLVHYHFFPPDSRGFRHLTRYAGFLSYHGWEPVVLTKARTSLDDEDRRWGMDERGELSTATPCGIEVHGVKAPEGASALLATHLRLARLAETVEPTWLRSVIRVGKKPLSALSPFFWDYPDAFLPWVDAAVAEGAKILREGKIDAIVSHCPIESNHLVASRLAARFRKPWFPFFGDLYGYYLPGRVQSTGAQWMRFLGRQLRRKWLSSAERGFAVSPAMAKYLQDHYSLKTDLFVVGYDERAFPLDTTGESSASFRIAHTGSIYRDQPVELFLDGVARFLKEAPHARLELRFVGAKSEERLRKEALSRGLLGVCRFEATVPVQESIRIQRQSELLIAFNLVPRPAEGTLSYPSKVFEYLASGRPILLIPSDHDFIDTLLEKSRGGKCVSSIEEIAACLNSYYVAWEKTGRLASTTRTDLVREYSSQNQAAKIARIMNASLA